MINTLIHARDHLDWPITQVYTRKTTDTKGSAHDIGRKEEGGGCLGTKNEEGESQETVKH